MNKKILISVIIIIAVIAGIVIFKPENERKVQNQVAENVVTENETANKIEDIKNETGATADGEMYEVQQEYDGREILTIKPDIQFKTVLTGIFKSGKPSEQDIKQLDLSSFHKGLWISEVSRNKFLQILKKCGVENFDIDDEGYLYKIADNSNEYSSRLEELINSDKLTIIDITGTCFMRDEMTGEVIEYPFKDMDLYQICEKFDTEGSSIIIITTNDVDEVDILEAIIG